MKWFLGFLASALVCVVLFFGSFMIGLIPTAYPNAGQEAVLIARPILFGTGGVYPNPVKTGRTITAWTTKVVYVDMKPVQYPIHFEDFMSKDGVPLDFDAVIRLKVEDSVKLIQTFGPEWYETNVEAEFANRVRQAVRKHGMNETAIDTTAIDDIDHEVSTAMEEYLKDAGLPIHLIQVTVGKANPPDAIKSQRIETAQQQQRQKTEMERKLSEDQRKAAEESRAAADNAYREALDLSPDQFIALAQVNMMEKVCAPDKATPCTFIISSGEKTPLVSIPIAGVNQPKVETEPTKTP